MKKLFFLLFFLPTLAFGQGAEEPILMSRLNVGIVGGGVAAGAPATYLLSEDFEGLSACGDSSHTNCRLTWTKLGTFTTDFNYGTSPAPLEGLNSIKLSGSGDTSEDGVVGSFTGTDPVYFYFIFNAPTRVSSVTYLDIMDASDNILMRFSDAGPEFSIYCNDNLHYSTTITAGTTYHIWGDYSKGEGANAACHLYHATNSTKPASPNITGTDGNATGTAAKIKLRFESSDSVLIFDKIRVKSSVIGSTPD